MPRSRSGRRWRNILASILATVALFALAGACSQNTLLMVAAGIFYVGESAFCSLGLCGSIPEGMTLTELSEDTGAGPLVAIDVDEQGRVFAAHSDRMDDGVLDNRDFTEAELDEELALQTTRDRVAMLERWVARGRLEADSLTRASDQVIVLSDEDGDGLLETRTELATFNAPESGIGSGVLTYDDELYYTNIPDLWRLRDTDGDGLPETEERMSTGWGVRWAFYGHDMHGLVLGPDGKIYFSIGDRGFQVETRDGRVLRPDIDVGRGAVLRMNPDGSELEIFAQGLRNPQELAFDDFGNLFTGDNNSDSIDQARIVYVVEGGDSGWAMPYQLLREEDYERGPWNAEKLWHPEHEGQPAWVMPPLRFIGRGPSGFAHAPGLGLPDRYRNHFFLADYVYLRSVSGIRTFSVEPKGAGYEASEPEMFLGGILAVDMAFALDGSMYVSWYKQIPPPRHGGLYRLALDAETAAPQAERIREMGEIVRAGMEHRSADEIAKLLGFEDRRVRMPAQFELVRRRDAKTLGAVARDRNADLLARLHAIWGLGQLGPSALRDGGWHGLDWARDDAAEVRAQAVRVVGTAPAVSFAPDVVPFLRDENARVRYFAALSLGKTQYRPAIPDLIELLRENDGRDIHLRHASSVALHEMNDPDALAAHADDPSAAARMGVLLAMRRGRDPRIANFLADPDPRLVVEAARAIHDLPIDEAQAGLAALAGSRLPYSDDDPQTSYALHRRVINSNLRIGTPEAAARLARHAADPGTPEAMRREALTALGHFTAPPPRDAVLGVWMPHDERDASVVHAALDKHVPTLLDTPLEGQALDVATVYGRVPLDDDELVERIQDDDADTRTRVASLQALAARADDDSAAALGVAVSRSLRSDDPELRAEARDVLARFDPPSAIQSIDALRDAAPGIERQRAVATLASMQTNEADERLVQALEQLQVGTLPPDEGLDVLQAARSRDTDALRRGLRRYETSLDLGDPLAPYRVAIWGGDPKRGAAVFNGNGDCKRCHRVDGEGAETGPDLSYLADRYEREEILEAIIAPNARIARGFEQEAGGSAMPPIAVELPPGELRDLMAYLSGLK